MLFAKQIEKSDEKNIPFVDEHVEKIPSKILICGLVEVVILKFWLMTLKSKIS